MHVANGSLTPRSTSRARVPTARAHDLTPWVRRIEAFSAALPYRKVAEAIGPDPQSLRTTTAILRFERLDVDEFASSAPAGAAPRSMPSRGIAHPWSRTGSAAGSSCG